MFEQQIPHELQWPNRGKKLSMLHQPTFSYIFERSDVVIDPTAGAMADTDSALMLQEPTWAVVYFKQIRGHQCFCPESTILNGLFVNDLLYIDNAIIVSERVTQGRKTLSEKRLYSICKSQFTQVPVFDSSCVAFEFSIHISDAVTSDAITTSFKCLVNQSVNLFEVEKMEIHRPTRYTNQ